MSDLLHTPQIRESVMAKIKDSGVRMRPRWHFLLLSVLAGAGALIVLMTLLYVTSLAVFFMRESGVWFAPAFGARGWYELARSAPIMLLVLMAVFAAVLEILVRKYSFAYKRPLIASLGVILLVVFGGGFALAQTALHAHLSGEAKHGRLPAPIGVMYGAHMRPPPPGDLYRGLIILETDDGFILFDENGNGTSTIIVTSKTRLPFGKDFSPGDLVVVIGDRIGTSTVHAFGVRALNEVRCEKCTVKDK